MIVGVGVDLVAIKRIERAFSRRPERFLERIFTDAERRLLQKRRCYTPALAARFAGKEAALKAIGCGIGAAALKEVEILAFPGKQPQVRLHGAAARLAEERGITGIALSLTHEHPFAGAIAVAYGSQLRFQEPKLTSI